MLITLIFLPGNSFQHRAGSTEDQEVVVQWLIRCDGVVGEYCWWFRTNQPVSALDRFLVHTFQNPLTMHFYEVLQIRQGTGILG